MLRLITSPIALALAGLLGSTAATIIAAHLAARAGERAGFERARRIYREDLRQPLN